jgi:hypothetical protein
MTSSSATRRLGQWKARLVAAALAATACLAVTASANATTFNPLPPGGLDAAIASANSNPGPDTIVLQNAIYQPAGTLTITDPVTITGDPKFTGQGARIDGGPAEAATPGDLFVVQADTVWKALTVQTSSENGSAAIDVQSGTTTTIGASFVGNNGSGLISQPGATVDAVNTNIGDGTSNAITSNGGNVNLLNDTLTKNGGGGLVNFGGNIAVKNTLILKNDPNSIGTTDCSGDPVISAIATMDSDSSCAVPLHNSSTTLLAVSGQYGGPTPGHVPNSGSAVLDVAAADANCPGVDQRFFVRPVGTHCDLGSMERGSSNTQGTLDNTAPTCAVTATNYPAGQPATQDVTVSDAGGVFDGVSNVTVSTGQADIAALLPVFPTASEVVRATKHTAAQPVNDTRWSFTASDVSGNSRVCQ